MAAATIHRLHAEAWRVLQAPYICSLKGLHDVLRTVDRVSLSRWAKCNSCVIEGLASKVIECLWTSQDALKILEILSTCSSARNAFLRRHPGLLESLSKRALEHENTNDQYGRSCIALLSRALPEEIALPATLLPFFMRVFHQAAHSPSAETIRPIYVLLLGNCRDLLDVIPSKTMIQFQEQLVKILRSLEDHTVCLLCLGILAVISTSNLWPDHTKEDTVDRRRSSNSSISSESILFSESLKQFFTARKAPKTLEFISLQVAYACSGSNNMSIDEVAEYVELAHTIAGAISSEIKQEFVKCNGRGVRKLLEKSFHPSNRYLGLQMRALDFVLEGMHASIPNAPPTNANVQSIASGLLDVSKSLTTVISARCAVELLLIMDEQNIFLLLKTLLDVSAFREKPTFEELCNMENLAVIIEGFIQVFPESSALRTAVLHAISEASSKNITSFFQSGTSMRFEESFCESGVCGREFRLAQERLRERIRTLIIKIAFCEQGHGTCLDKSVIYMLIDQQHEEFPNPCPEFSRLFSSGISRSADSILLPGTNFQNISSSHWRERLGESLIMNAKAQYQQIVQQLGSVCRELEERCDQVEAPLRHEKFRSEELETRLLEAENRVKELESIITERSLFQIGAEAELAALRNQAETAENKVDDYSREILSLRDLLQSSESSAKIMQTRLEEDLRRRDLESIAIMTGKDATIDELMSKVSTMEGIVSEREREYTIVVEEKRKAMEINGELERALVIAENEMKLKDVTSCKIEQELEDLQKLSTDLETNLESINDKVRRIESVNTNLLEEHESAKQALQRELGLELSTDESENGKPLLNPLIAELIERFKICETRSKNEVESANLKQLKMEGLLESQLKEITEKRNELSELRDWKERLIMVMGYNNSGFAASSAKETRSEAARYEERTPKRSRTQKMPIAPTDNHRLDVSFSRDANSSHSDCPRQPLRDIRQGKDACRGTARAKKSLRRGPVNLTQHQDAEPSPCKRLSVNEQYINLSGKPNCSDGSESRQSLVYESSNGRNSHAGDGASHRQLNLYITSTEKGEGENNFQNQGTDCQPTFESMQKFNPPSTVHGSEAMNENDETILDC